MRVYVQPGDETSASAWNSIHKTCLHIDAHNVEHVGDNGESACRVGSCKVRGTERGENIQFNFETAPAQSTNTKASLQAYPCWRLELIHCLEAQGGERTAGKEGEGGDRESDTELSREKRWGDIGRKTREEWRKYTAAVSLPWRREREFNTTGAT